MICLDDLSRVSPAWYPLPAAGTAAVAGYIDGLFEDEIRGWVADMDRPSRILTVCIRVNEVLAGKTTACLYRSDLVSIFQSSGLHGFAFRIPERFFSEDLWNVEILLEDGRYLAPRPLKIANGSVRAWPSESKRKPCLLFIHIPKAAGTALRSALTDDTHLARQLVLYPDAPGFPGEYLLHLAESQLANLDFIYGHFGFRLHECMPKECEYATTLREPISRTLSHYLHLKRTVAPGDDPLNTLSAEDFSTYSTGADFDNLMTRLVSGETADVLPTGGVNETVYEHAIQNIKRSFTFVGLQEHLSETARQLAGRLELPVRPLTRENIANTPAIETVSPALIESIREVNEYDIRLYDYVREEFWANGRNGWVDQKRSVAQRTV